MRVIGMFLFGLFELEILCAGLVYVFFGGALLWVGARYLAKLPKVKLWKCVWIYLLADLLGCLVGIAIWIGIGTHSSSGFMIGCLGIRLAVTWTILSLLLKTSFLKAIGAWLPTILVGCFSFALLGTMSPDDPEKSREWARIRICNSMLKGISTAIYYYREENEGQYPSDLESLLDLPRDNLSCTSDDWNQPTSYFYLPPAEVVDTKNTIMVCDYQGNHVQERRNVLCLDGYTKTLTEDQFQQELGKPINAAFAEALKAAEKLRAIE